MVAGLAGSAALIAALTVAARLTGFGRTLAFSAAVGGQGCLGTAYATANRLPNVLFEVAAGGALAGAVVPVLAGRLAAGRREDADQAASALLTWTVLLLTPLALLLAAVSGPLTAALLGGTGGTVCSWTATDAATMLVLFAPQVVLYGVGIVLAGVLQAHSRFGWPAAAPLLSSLTVIGAYLAFGALAGGAQEAAAWRPGAGPLLVLGAGTTLGVAALSLPLLIPVRRTGTRLRPTLRFPGGAAAQLRVLAFAGLGALLAQQVAVVVTVVLANRVGGTGAFTVVEFAQTVYLLPYAVLAVPVATAAFPRLSAQAASGDDAGYAATLAATTRVVVLAGLAGTGLLAAVAPAVQALFLGLDAVGGGLLPHLGATLTAFAPGLLGWGLVAHLGRALYAAQQGRAAAVATISGWTAAALAAAAAVLVLDAVTDDGGRAAVVGLALGNSVGMTLAGALLLRAVRRRSGAAALRGTGRAFLAAAAAAAAAVAAGRPVAVVLAGGGAAVSPWAAVAAGIVAAVVASVAFALVAAALDRPAAVALAARLRRTRP